MASYEIDGFYKVMQKTHVVYKTAMVIPRSFYHKHSAQLDEGVHLQHKTGGHIWPAMVVAGAAEGHQIARGWKCFVEDNKLESSEIVVFRVPPDAPREGPLLLKFQVFDAVDGVEKPPVPGPAQGRGSSSRRRKNKRLESVSANTSSSSSSAPALVVPVGDSQTSPESSEPTEEDDE